MTQKKNLTLNGMTIPHFLLVAAALAMTGFSIYLLKYDIQTIYPLGQMDSSSFLCSGTGFFSCSKAVYSPAAFIFGIPIALIGILAGLFLIFSSIFPSEKKEGTNHIFVLLNALGCFIIFLYSLIVLKGLCPYCTLYYISSWFAAFIFYRYSDLRKIDLKIFASYALIAIAAIGLYFWYITDRKAEMAKAVEPLLKQYYSYPDLGNPSKDSPFVITKSTEKFADAPIRISVFSDFQCPFCGKVATSFHDLILKYKGKINIQYYFYPMDNACNSDMQGPMHPSACKAAYLSACVPQDFAKVHDKLFEKGPEITDEWLDNYAKELGVEKCYKNEETKAQVMDLINVAREFRITATPTLLINGVKVEGALPPLQMNIILDDLLKKAQK